MDNPETASSGQTESHTLLLSYDSGFTFPGKFLTKRAKLPPDEEKIRAEINLRIH